MEEIVNWVTREGNIIQIKDMSDKHLINALTMLVRNDRKISKEYTALLAEHHRRQAEFYRKTLRRKRGI